jgi:hypothetical protein
LNFEGEYMPKVIKVNDKMQAGYSYRLTEPQGTNFHPGFAPELSPREMLELGVFGGRYLRDCRKEFPDNWFGKARFHPEGKPGHDPKLNYLGVDASQPLSYWRKKGWISPRDPRGWFQWYCRYYLGRRSDDDERQIRRWKAIRRHISQIEKHCPKGDLNCRTRQRQAVLHWAYDPRKL